MNPTEADPLAPTREKLRLLEERYAASFHDDDANTYVAELSRRSLKRLINQLKEEIARAKAAASSRMA